MKTTILRSVWQLPHVAVLGCVLGLTFDFTVHATMPVVSNVRATQRPGTKLVDTQWSIARVSPASSTSQTTCSL